MKKRKATITNDDITEFKEHCPLKLNTRYKVYGYYLTVGIKTNNILFVSAYPTSVYRDDALVKGERIIKVNVEVYRKALVEVGLLQAMENKYRKAQNLLPLPRSGESYKLAKELLLEVTKQEANNYLP
ncbi:hypothetical protein [uncultured Aliivibrio sp.]|uniref:hypothetical protein n=1 Tax=uncultured Aliivibrio sp. TaxID=873085 RepID=UPI0026283581|nr:hypothetical protein [uncultured Aliivibrio sp.]